jgi:hypothetical protein
MVFNCKIICCTILVGTVFTGLDGVVKMQLHWRITDTPFG